MTCSHNEQRRSLPHPDPILMRVSSIVAMLVVGAGCSSARKTEPASPAPAQSATAATAPAPAKDSVTLERDRYVAEVRAADRGEGDAAGVAGLQEHQDADATSRPAVCSPS